MKIIEEMIKKVVIFDADNTLWRTEGGDYVSRVDSEFISLDSSTVLRVEDDSKYYLNEGIYEFLAYNFNSSMRIGLVSDNHWKDVEEVCKLFGIWRYFDKDLMRVELYDGYCPKAKLIGEMLGLEEISIIKAVWLDDRDYSLEAKEEGIEFFQIMNNQIRKVLDELEK